jgi:predicted regulator of Ras-like GTPase activity (Roadblock/LC7/MglB family)
VLSESMTGASSVWNAMLGMWNQVKAQPGWDPAAHPAMMGMGDFPIKVSELDAPPAPATGAQAAPARVATAGGAVALPTADTTLPAMRISRSLLDPTRARKALAGMLSLDGLLGCAVVDGTTGLVLARETREDHPVDMDLVAAGCAQVLRAHRQAARSMGMAEQVDEVMTTAGPRQQVVRTLSRHPDLFLVAMLDKHRTNLALARFQLMEVERGLV